MEIFLSYIMVIHMAFFKFCIFECLDINLHKSLKVSKQNNK